jgi:hypothetical protein
VRGKPCLPRIRSIVLFWSSPDDSTSSGVLLIPQCSSLLPLCLPGSIFHLTHLHRLHYTSAEKFVVDLRRLITTPTSLTSAAATSSPGLSEAFNLKVWTLGFRLWNAYVDRANSSALLKNPADRVAEAEIQQACFEKGTSAAPTSPPPASRKARRSLRRRHRRGSDCLAEQRRRRP